MSIDHLKTTTDTHKKKLSLDHLQSLKHVSPSPGEDRFSAEATTALEEITRGVALLAQVNPPSSAERLLGVNAAARPTDLVSLFCP